MMIHENHGLYIYIYPRLTEAFNGHVPQATNSRRRISTECVYFYHPWPYWGWSTIRFRYYIINKQKTCNLHWWAFTN